MPSPKRRAPRHEPVGDGPSLAQRREWADGHERLMARLRESGHLKPGDPHYTCTHLRLDDPAWRPRSRTERPAWSTVRHLAPEPVPA